MRRAVIALLLLASTHAAAASPRQDLEDGRRAFRNKDCQSASKTLRNLVFPSEQLAGRDDLFDVYAMLGACDVETGRQNDANSEFDKAIQLAPDRSLDPLFYSSGAIRAYEQRKADLEAEAKRQAALRAAEEAREAAKRYLESLHVVERHSYAVNFAPFGFGQFQNHQWKKGVAFLSGQALTLGASAGTWFYLVSKYGISSTHVQAADVSTVNLLERIEVGTGVAFLGLYVWSVLDGLKHFKPNVEIPNEDLPPELRKPERKKTGLRLLPMITPTGGVGIGLGWEN